MRAWRKSPTREKLLKKLLRESLGRADLSRSELRTLERMAVSFKQKVSKLLATVAGAGEIAELCKFYDLVQGGKIRLRCPISF